MSLSSLLQQSMRSSVGPSDPEWQQFILDHLDYIAAQSNKFTIDSIVMSQYRYDLTRYLKVEMTRHEDITWIVQLLNDLPNDLSFDTPGDYVIPTDRQITDLYLSYKTINSNE